MSVPNPANQDNRPTYKDMNEHGWFRLPRLLFEDALLRRPQYLAVFCWLNSQVAWSSGKKSTMFKGERIWLEVGQLTAGSYEIAKATGVPRSTVERILKNFQRGELIELQSSNKCSLITLKNSHLFKKNEEQNEEQTSGAVGIDGHSIKTDKKEKNEKSSRFQNMSDEELGNAFKVTVLRNGWWDEGYAEKTWDQGIKLPRENKTEFRRKVSVMLNMAQRSSLHGRVRTLCNEIAGFVNDKGAEKMLTEKEQVARQQFQEGNKYD